MGAEVENVGLRGSKHFYILARTGLVDAQRRYGLIVDAGSKGLTGETCGRESGGHTQRVP